MIDDLPFSILILTPFSASSLSHFLSHFPLPRSVRHPVLPPISFPPLHIRSSQRRTEPPPSFLLSQVKWKETTPISDCGPRTQQEGWLLPS